MAHAVTVAKEVAAEAPPKQAADIPNGPEAAKEPAVDEREEDLLQEEGGSEEG